MLGKRHSKAPEREGYVDITAPGLSFAQPKGGMSKDRGTETQGPPVAPTPRDAKAASRTSAAAAAPSDRGAGHGRAAQPGKRSGGQAAERPPAAKRARVGHGSERSSGQGLSGRRVSRAVDAYDPQAEASRPQLAGGDAQSDGGHRRAAAKALLAADPEPELGEGTAQLSDSEWLAALGVGSKLYCEDKAGNGGRGGWFPAKVVDVDKSSRPLKVHYLGWHAKFDVWVQRKIGVLQRRRMQPEERRDDGQSGQCRACQGAHKRHTCGRQHGGAGDGDADDAGQQGAQATSSEEEGDSDADSEEEDEEGQAATGKIEGRFVELYRSSSLQLYRSTKGIYYNVAAENRGNGQFRRYLAAHQWVADAKGNRLGKGQEALVLSVKPPPRAPAPETAQTEGARGADQEKPPNSAFQNLYHFTPEVDEWLVNYIDKHGNQKSSWDSLTKLFDGERSEASLRSRWSRLAKGLVKGQTVQPGNVKVVPLDPVSAALQRQVQFNSILIRF